LNNCQARALITSGKQLELTQQLIQVVPSLKTIVLTLPLSEASATDLLGFLSYDSIQSDYSEQRPHKTNVDVDLACLIYTSGSTGDPKGVMSDHSNVVFAASSIIEYLGNVETDIVIGLLPLSFDYGLYQLLMVFKFGGTLVLEKGFTFPAAILKRIEAERVTGFPGVPTIFTVLLKLDLSPYDLSSLRYVTNTAAALPPSHIAELRNKFPGVTLFSMYGLTETKRTLYLPPEELDRRPGSVGIAIPGTEVWIEDEAGQRLGPGEVGELVARGRHVMRGYWNDPEKTAARFRSGPLPGERVCYTGDLFRLDEEGFFYFVARKDDVIKSRGEKVAPKEVENVLYSLAGVREAAVIGVPDPVLGQAVKAFVVVDRDTLTDADILRHCRTHLEDFMVPKYVELCDELPKTSTGKIKKTDLK
jgi:acyl-CoA synthetase (AMP-forming)/AMP-acid ligase II